MVPPLLVITHFVFVVGNNPLVFAFLCLVAGSGEGTPIVFLASLKAAGLGTNLTAGSHCMQISVCNTLVCSCFRATLQAVVRAAPSCFWPASRQLAWGPT
jgi:hypothetical protein